MNNKDMRYKKACALTIAAIITTTMLGGCSLPFGTPSAEKLIKGAMEDLNAATYVKANIDLNIDANVNFFVEIGGTISTTGTEVELVKDGENLTTHTKGSVTLALDDDLVMQLQSLGTEVKADDLTQTVTGEVYTDKDWAYAYEDESSTWSKTSLADAKEFDINSYIPADEEIDYSTYTVAKTDAGYILTQQLSFQDIEEVVNKILSKSEDVENLGLKFDYEKAYAEIIFNFNKEGFNKYKISNVTYKIGNVSASEETYGVGFELTSLEFTVNFVEINTTGTIVIPDDAKNAPEENLSTDVLTDSIMGTSEETYDGSEYEYTDDSGYEEYESSNESDIDESSSDSGTGYNDFDYEEGEEQYEYDPSIVYNPSVDD
ncbi:hypothetical protein [Butyrivibrio fibrisolvens]|uniref:hypothetical protein n=1 Tax=Butyrivibrio fibrisolvens TaxID=831 RepID=UPI0003B60B8B|nr:hypothetical protein [Butyrivibrio fibrisolvens]